MIVLTASCKVIDTSISQLKANNSSLPSTRLLAKDGCPPVHSKPMDCEEVLKNGQKTNGVYTIWPRSRIFEKESVRVYCDMKTLGGGWTVIQRRGDFGSPENYFSKSWNYYKKGFGTLTRDFWIGNDVIYALTNQASYTVRFEMQHSNSTKAYALYDEFWIDNEDQKYRLHISGYSGTAGDSMSNHDRENFSTQDSGYYCAVNRRSGWWFHNCLNANLNGIYRNGKYTASYQDGMEWESFGGSYNSMVSSEIKIRPAQFG
ncbi:techylectin-5A [Caerostris darwini]|uniref:Techylectin-5A n=2 Tax=Caerostris darwini TaxID=1538125 RepID=A0AAV4Q2S7_9ARAC|nr:techylectin-5A [Caerostris darwini]